MITWVEWVKVGFFWALTVSLTIVYCRAVFPQQETLLCSVDMSGIHLEYTPPVE